MTTDSSGFSITWLQWFRMHLGLTAIEQSGSRLTYRFEFGRDIESDITCDIYYIDDASNSMKGVSESERVEIYEGRIALGMDIIRRSLELAELPQGFTWTPTFEFVLQEDSGMGGKAVYRTKKILAWPERSRT